MQGACGEHGDISRVETWPAEELSAPWEVVWHLWFPSTNISHSAAEAHRALMLCLLLQEKESEG